MKHISSTLLNIIGGSANGVGNDTRVDIKVKKGIRGALAAVTARKGIGKNVVPYKKAKGVRPDQVIPMDEGQFKDF
jgi:hypothetical protein